MSERDEQRSRVRVGEVEVDLMRENVALYTFWGDLAVYNHVFVAFNEHSDNVISKGGYAFAGQDIYESLVEFVVQNDCPQYLNMLRVKDCDKDAYINHETLELKHADTFPEDWND